MKVALLRRVRRALFGSLRILSVAALAALVVACATPLPRPEAADQDQLASLFAETYRKIEDVHIEPVDTAGLAVAGLGNLASAEEGLSVALTRDGVVLRRDGMAFHRFQTPPGDDHNAWGAVTGDAIVAAVEASRALRDLEPQRLYDLFIAGLVPQLAAPSEFFPGHSVFTVLQARTTRKFDMGYELVADGAQIARLDPRGELEAQGLKLGDVITHIEGRPTAGLSKLAVFESLGSRLVFGSTKVTVRRAGSPTPINFDLWRTEGEARNLRIFDDARIAEYRFVDVDYSSSTSLARSVSVGAGHPFRGFAGEKFQAHSILLDLRNTPDHPDLPNFTDSGAAVRLADIFLGEGLAGAARSRHARLNEEWRTNRFVAGRDYPLVIVVDQTTSGAAEIAAAALQDHGRALVVGSSTAGNGKLHRLLALPSGGHLVTPSALAYTPAGYPIEARGVTPHICTSLPGATLERLLAALRRGEGLIPEEQRARVVAPDDAAAVEAQRALCPAAPDSGDLAYELAQAILREPGLYRRFMQLGAGS